MNFRPPGDFGNCRGREVAGLGKRRRRGASPHPRTRARAYRPSHPPRSNRTSGDWRRGPSGDPLPHRPKTWQAFGGDRRQGLRALRGRGELCLLGLCVPQSVCACTCSWDRVRKAACVRRTLGCLLVGPSGCSCRSLPRRGSLRVACSVLVALGAAVCRFAVCLLVTTSARADGASGGGETDGDAWAARTPRRPHSSFRHAHTHTYTTHAHAHTLCPPLHVAK